MIIKIGHLPRHPVTGEPCIRFHETLVPIRHILRDRTPGKDNIKPPPLQRVGKE